MCVRRGRSLALFASAGTASALTLGGCAAGPRQSSACPTEVIGEFTNDPSTPYYVPTGGGTITQWQTNTPMTGSSGGAAGATVTFAVLAPAGGANYTVVGADSEPLPNPLPSSGIASFTLASPIPVVAGDTIAIYSSSPDVMCWFDSGATPAADSLMNLYESSFPVTTGQTLAPRGILRATGTAGRRTCRRRCSRPRTPR